MKKTLANYYLLSMVFVIALLIFTITIISSNTHKSFLELFINDMQNNLTLNYKKELKNRLDFVEQYIDGQKNRAEDRLKHTLSTRVIEAHAIANNLYQKYKDKKSTREIKELIIESLRKIRFNNGRGYYFIDNIEGKCLLFPLSPKLEGTSFFNIQDINKKYVVQEFIEIVKTKGEGFSEYYTNKYKLQAGEKYKKIAYVKLFEPYDFIIGTGEYVIDVEETIKKEVANQVNDFTSINRNSYINIYEVHDFNGGKDFATMIVNQNREDLVGKKIDSDSIDIAGVKYRQEILDVINKYDAGFVTYKYKKIDSDEISEKLSYVKRLKHWNWVLSTGIHLDDLDALIKEHKMKTEAIEESGQNDSRLFFLICCLILMIFSLFVSKKINFEFKNMILLFKYATEKKKRITSEDFISDDFKSLSHYANEMVDIIHSKQEKLEDLNTKLEVKVELKTREITKVNTFLEEKNSELEKNYYIDYLTGLNNRNKFLRDILSVDKITVVIFDIDGFKNINDFYGLKSGDNLLKHLANILNDFAIQNNMNVYRLSSDEFLLSFYENMNNEELENLSKVLQINFAQIGFFDKMSELNIATTLTFAFADGKENILSKVDMALNYAKENKFAYAIYDSKNHHMDKHKHNIYWREKIQWAIDNDLIQPYFQRIVNYKNKDEKKFEALVRIIDDEEVISPYQFLDIAKETKQYQYITRIMIEKSFEAFHNTNISFSINISMSDVENKETIDFLIQKIEEYNIHDQLILEILETEDMLDSKKFLPFVELMRSNGVRFALDDFGSGYSNFAFLLKMHPRFLKIDGSLIKNITKDKNSYKIVETIVAFAKNMDSIVIAEFVENEEIVFVLDELGIQYMQGYHFSTPSPYFN